MELKTGWKIFALIVFALRQQIIFAQNDCVSSGKQVDVSAFYNTTVTSPNYPSEYDDYSDCAWRLSAESGYVVKVVFNDFKLQIGEPRLVNNPCPYDALTFRDGFSASSSLLGVYCFTVHPEVIFSTGRYLYIKFSSNYRFVNKGFSISVSAVKKEESYGSCRPRTSAGKEYWPYGSSGTLYTPDYPIPYPDGATCIWTISVPLGRRVKLTFEHFELAKSSFRAGYGYCKYDKLTTDGDYVEIRDGAWSDSRELGIYCGNKLDFEFYSTGRHMWVKFHSISDGKKEDKGFKAHFEAVETIFSEELCLPGNPNNNNLKLTGSDGTLQSPLKYYPPDMRCDWLITVPEGNIVKLSFDRFEVGYDATTGKCKGDYVEVLDDNKNKGRFCGYTSPSVISSSGRNMRVRFTSDSKGPVYRGFKATFTYTAVTKTSSKGLTVAVIILGVVLFLVLVCLVVCVLKRRRAPNSEGSVRVPISTITSQSHAIQAGATEHSTTPSSEIPDQPEATSHTTHYVGNASVSTDPPLPLTAGPGLQPPFSKEGELQLQFPPSGESYPWQQSAPIQYSTSYESTF